MITATMLTLCPSDFEFRIGEQEVDAPFLEFRTLQAFRPEKWQWFHDRLVQQFGDLIHVGKYVSIYVFNEQPTTSSTWRETCERLVGAGFKRVR
tara:strand:+ start:189 stop:470 length:282 start_codon:yes stop_codon:yes gene_type:complete